MLGTKVNDVEQALSTTGHSLAYYNRDENETVKSFVMSKINNAVNTFNVGVPMTPAQIGSCSKRIYEKYHFLKPEEFECICKNASTGMYGQPLRVNEVFVNTWFEDWVDERHLLAETISIEAKVTDQKEPMEVTKDFYDKFSIGVPEKETPVTPKMKYTPTKKSPKEQAEQDEKDIEEFQKKLLKGLKKRKT